MEKKYEMTGETREVLCHTLHRIRALRKFFEVKPGDLGGWIESESNLSHEDIAWVGGEACVLENARVYGSARVYDHTLIRGETHVGGEECISEYK